MFFPLQEDILSIWNRTANDYAVTNGIRDTFCRVLNLPPGTVTSTRRTSTQSSEIEKRKIPLKLSFINLL